MPFIVSILVESASSLLDVLNLVTAQSSTVLLTYYTIAIYYPHRGPGISGTGRTISFHQKCAQAVLNLFL